MCANRNAATSIQDPSRRSSVLSRLRWPESPFAVLLFLLCSFAVCFYWSRIERNWGGSENPRAALRTDLFAQWYGTRELLLRHRNPYSDDVTQEIQTAYYGRPLDDKQLTNISHQQRFAYPLYVVFFLAPLIKLPYASVEAICLCVFAALTSASVILWLRVVRVSLAPVSVLLLLWFFFTSIPVLQAIDLLQLALLVAFFLAAACACAVGGHFFFSGVFLALGTIKPQLSIALIIWLLVWAVSGWRQRRNLVLGFAFTITALVLSADWLMRGWIGSFIAALHAYKSRTGSPPLIGILFPMPLQLLVGGVVLWFTLRCAWKARNRPAASASFALAIAFVLTATTILAPLTFQPFNYVVLLPVLLLVVRDWSELRQRSKAAIALEYSCYTLALLPWAFALAVSAGMLIPALTGLQRIWFAPLNMTLGLPFAAFGILILMSVAFAKKANFLVRSHKS
jgi:hypothetical protein